MREIWKPISDYEGLYKISNTGKVNSLISGKILKPFPNNKGYLYVKLTKDGQHKTFSVHRLVANVFIPNVESMQQVNHIDGNKQNNCAENLEWCNDFENRTHAYKNGLRKMETIIGIEMLSTNGNCIKEFLSISEASRETGINIGNISRCCNGGCRTAGGYVFKRKVI